MPFYICLSDGETNKKKTLLKANGRVNLYNGFGVLILLMCYRETL